nr:SpoIID/LytB domain-containing protein [Lachnospiraceae bacterium]
MRRKVIVWVSLIFTLAVIFMIGSAFLLQKAKEDSAQEKISLQQVEQILAYASLECQSEFGQRCRETIEEKGYLPYDETMNALIAYVREKQPELEMGYKSLAVIAVDGDSILVRNENETMIREFSLDFIDVDTEGENRTEQPDSEVIKPGDMMKVFATRDKVLLLRDIYETKIELEKVWIKANTDQTLKIVCGDKEFSGTNFDSSYSGCEDIADIVIKKGGCKSVKPYTDKINAKLISIKPRTIELENFGTYEYDDRIQVYKLFGEYEPYTLSDLQIGYDFTDFVLDEDGKIVAALATREGYLDKIRVVIKTSEFASAYHEEVILRCDTDMEWKSGDKEGLIEGGEKVVIGNNSEYFGNDRIVFWPAALSARTSLLSVMRNQGTPSYRGMIEVERTQEGLLVINELPLDEYLYSVVPSEMPASYPLEALKAQAVSARTYAYAHMQTSRLQSYGAHVDDSAAFQVYNNITEHEMTTRAVRETEGIIVCQNSKPVTTYFYSTSCGFGTDLSAWMAEDEGYLKARKIGVATSDEEAEIAIVREEEEFRRFICNADADSYEADDAYYRWKYETQVDEELLLVNLQKRYGADPEQILTKTPKGYVSKEIKKFGELKNIEIVRRADGGAVTEMVLTGSDATIKVLSEKNVRYILANSSTELKLGVGYEKDGVANGMLPSAFLVLDAVYEPSEAEDEEKKIVSYVVYGGGFGHGIGMSQNGAKQMAHRGMDFRSVLHFFYVDTELEEMKKEK